MGMMVFGRRVPGLETTKQGMICGMYEDKPASRCLAMMILAMMDPIQLEM